LREQVVELAVNQLDALAVRGLALAAVHGQRAVEVVHDEQQLLQQVDDRLVGLLAALALDALAVVVELGALAQPPIAKSSRSRCSRRPASRRRPVCLDRSRSRPAIESRLISMNGLAEAHLIGIVQHERETACAAPSTTAIARE
jgi:hypothetical protein